jgi:hypothetical protein
MSPWAMGEDFLTETTKKEHPNLAPVNQALIDQHHKFLAGDFFYSLTDS